MITTIVVLMLWLPTGYGGTSYTAEFNSVESCEQAANSMIEKMKYKIYSGTPVYTCTSKM